VAVTRAVAKELAAEGASVQGSQAAIK